MSRRMRNYISSFIRRKVCLTRAKKRRNTSRMEKESSAKWPSRLDHQSHRRTWANSWIATISNCFKSI